MAQTTPENQPPSAGKAAKNTQQQNPQQQQQNASGAADTTNGKSTTTTDPTELLREDHRRVERLFGAFEKSGSAGEKSHLVEQICLELRIHTLLEEEIFYPACQGHMEKRLLDEAQVEHDGAKALIHEIEAASPEDEYFDAKVKVLSEAIKHHVREEEKPGEGILAKAKAGSIATPQLAERMTARKQELMQEAEAGGLRPLKVRSYRTGPEPRMPEPRIKETSKENEMPQRSMTMERDSRGRFRDDEDRDYRGSRGRSMPARDDEGRFISSRSRYDEDDDYRGRGRGRGGWYGDPEGHSEASHRGWDERGRSSTRYADDDDDYRGRGRGRGHGGWFGDPEGHAEASRRGWDDPDHGPSGWYGDPRGHAEAARRGWDDPDHRPSGWFGDPEGHSEASRRGWEERGGSRYRSRDDDDDYERRGGRGHGGWYGDPRGHSEASRAGWEERGETRYRSRDDDDDYERRGRGHGGWYGDPEGHARARRGR